MRPTCGLRDCGAAVPVSLAVVVLVEWRGGGRLGEGDVDVLGAGLEEAVLEEAVLEKHKR